MKITPDVVRCNLFLDFPDEQNCDYSFIFLFLFSFCFAIDNIIIFVPICSKSYIQLDGRAKCYCSTISRRITLGSALLLYFRFSSFDEILGSSSEDEADSFLVNFSSWIAVAATSPSNGPNGSSYPNFDTLYR